MSGTAPVMDLVGGPQGSGKSSLAPLALEALHGAIVAAADSPPGWMRAALQGTKYAL